MEMRGLLFFCSLFLFTLTSACNEEEPLIHTNPNPPTPTEQKDTIYYLALGDSYTIGQSVAPANRFPSHLRERISAEIDPAQETILATTGWTTGDLQNAINNTDFERPQYDLVTLLIGVNNQYRGYPLEDYKVGFRALLEQSIDFSSDRKERVFVVSIPDYGVTPFGENSGDPASIAEEIDAFNAAAKTICEEMGVAFLNITPISREAANEPDLIASDGLHPSGKMYKRWVDEVIYPAVEPILR